MTNDQATLIATYVKELARVRSGIDSVPNKEQSAIMRTHCNGLEAVQAMELCLGVLVEVGTTLDPLVLARATTRLASILALMHRDAGTRKVSAGEILRVLATASDKTDAFREKAALNPIEALLEALREQSGVNGPDDPDDSNGGRN